MNIQLILQEIQTLNPKWKRQEEAYRDLVDENINENSTVLDIGCGRTDYMCEVFKKANRVIGQDLDEQAISENYCINEKIVGDLDKLSILEKDSVDLAISCWTLEHLENPDELFSQLQRTLKTGAKFITLTPNKYSLISILSNLIPNKLHKKIVKIFWGRAEENTYPAFYKINSKKQISAFCDKYNLKIEEIRYLKDPSYYIFSKKLVKLFVKLHSIFIPKKMSEGMLIILVKN